MANNFDEGKYGRGRSLGDGKSDEKDSKTSRYKYYDPGWDDGSEVDEEEFLRQLEEEDDEIEDNTEASKAEPSALEQVQLQARERFAPPELIQRVFGVVELFEEISLRLPAYQLITSSRLVQRHWKQHHRTLLRTAGLLR